MQTYLKDWYRSRGIQIWEETIPCEVCLYNLIQWSIMWVNVWVDVHHILSSARGKRKHSKDGSDIVLLCSQHHTQYHWENGYTNREELLAIVQEMIKVYVRMWCKEKLWRLVEILYSKNVKWKQKIF
jgi:hypothetical protein